MSTTESVSYTSTGQSLGDLYLPPTGDAGLLRVMLAL